MLAHKEGGSCTWVCKTEDIELGRLESLPRAAAINWADAAALCLTDLHVRSPLGDDETEASDRKRQAQGPRIL